MMPHIRRWCWHLDEVFVRTNGEEPTICGARLTMKAKCLRFLPRSAGIAEAALKFLKRTMKRYGLPRTSIVTDRLGSYRRRDERDWHP